MSCHKMSSSGKFADDCDILADWLQVPAADTPLVLTMAMAPATSESRALMIKAIREGFSEEMDIMDYKVSSQVTQIISNFLYWNLFKFGYENDVKHWSIKTHSVILCIRPYLLLHDFPSLVPVGCPRHSLTNYLNLAVMELLQSSDGHLNISSRLNYWILHFGPGSR